MVEGMEHLSVILKEPMMASYSDSVTVYLMEQWWDLQKESNSVTMKVVDLVLLLDNKKVKEKALNLEQLSAE